MTGFSYDRNKKRQQKEEHPTMLEQCWAVLRILAWKLADTLQHGANGTPRRLEARNTGELVDVGRRALLRDMWLQTHLFLSLPPSPVLTNLWLGSAMNAADRTWLRAQGIACIVNVSQEVPNLYADEAGTFEYCQLQLRDVEGCQLPWRWTSRFLHRALTSQRPVLVHCFLGRSRSVAVVCHYLMSHLGYNFRQAYAFVSHRRPVASLNCDLAEELAALPPEGRVLRLPAATAQ